MSVSAAVAQMAEARRSPQTDPAAKICYKNTETVSTILSFPI